MTLAGLGRSAYLVAREIKRAAQKAIDEHTSPANRVIALAAGTAAHGTALLCYQIEPFLVEPGQPQPQSHSNYWASLEMARTFLDLGYNVDVVSARNKSFVPKKDYSVVVDLRRILQRIAPLLDERCVRIMHLDTAHIVFSNAAGSRRLLALQRRRGVTLTASRFEPPNLGIEHAHCATIHGNEFPMLTFGYARKPIFRLPIVPTVELPWPVGKDFDACRNRFLFLSSQALVHKGLDLVLEAFADMPECHLTVCGPVDSEPDFVEAYRRELYETPNIETIGWVDVAGPRFREITERCIGLILPSCSEGGSVSTVDCMHAGLIPIVTYETAVDVGDFGSVLKGDSVDHVKDAISRIASLPSSELEGRSREAWSHARSVHSRERFSAAYRNTIERIMTLFGRS
jgi:glycosyltransferase involved in cell wall biosynthesis